MSVYDVDFDQFAETQSPPDKRTPKALAWLRALLGQVSDDNGVIFGQYKQGSTDPVYTAGTYGLRAVVIFNGGVFESKIANNTTDPTNLDNWRRISESFIGTDERIGFRSEKLIFEYALNKWFGTVFRQPTSVSDIFITNNTLSIPVFIVGASETESSDIFEDTSTEPIIDEYSFTPEFSFSINIPLAVYNALGVAKESIVRNFADRYVVAGITYNIVTY